MAPKLSIHLLTLYPDMFPGPLGLSILGSALKKGVWNLNVTNIRDYAIDQHRTVDDTAYGGGPGMVLRPDVIGRALEGAEKRIPSDASITRLFMSPRGQPLTQQCVRRFSQVDHLVVLCGRFEGVDQRALDYYGFQEVSIGDYILAGGEIPAMALIESCVRLIPGVLNDPDSLTEETFVDDLLEYPQYTRPQEWKNHEVPEVLRSGHHEKIRSWRVRQAEELTKTRRPDLWSRRADKIKN